MRDAELLDAQFRRVRAAANPLFARLLVVQWIGAVVWAVLATPTSWNGASTQLSVHLWTALLLGGLATLPTLWLVRAHPQ